jgi:hypothetical protein
MDSFKSEFTKLSLLLANFAPTSPSRVNALCGLYWPWRALYLWPFEAGKLVGVAEPSSSRLSRTSSFFKSVEILAMCGFLEWQMLHSRASRAEVVAVARQFLSALSGPNRLSS